MEAGFCMNARNRSTLDFFILQSSLLSLLGSAGQGNYSAGNTFLDSLAAHRRAAGLPATAINWSAWSGGGLATVSGARGEAMWSSLGVKFISPDLAMQAFDKLMHRDVEPDRGRDCRLADLRRQGRQASVPGGTSEWKRGFRIAEIRAGERAPRLRLFCAVNGDSTPTAFGQIATAHHGGAWLCRPHRSGSTFE